jgi:single-stranded-DNA-specific exonuclease
MQNQITDSLHRERWHIVEVDEQVIGEYSEKYKLDPLLARLLLVRNIGDGIDDDILKFITPPKSLITDYGDITSKDHLIRATNRIADAVTNNERIMINGDPDADGISGGTILVASIRDLGGEAFYDFPTRSKEGHGLQPRIIDESKKLGCTLIVTSDCGSKDVEATDYANSQGLDVIICDHHVLGKNLPKAYALVNPHAFVGPSYSKGLSGAGVAFKLVLAVYEKLGREIRPEFLDYLLALVALGTISDRMSFLNPMNRILVNGGVDAINRTEMEGLRALKEISRSNYKELKSREIGRTIVPRLNAPGRIGDRDEGIPDSRIVLDLLLIGTGQTNQKKAIEILEQFTSVYEIEQKKNRTQAAGDALGEAAVVDEVNEKRKFITSKIEDEIDELIENQVDPQNDRIIVIRGKNWNPGVIGIDTDRLKDRFLRPAMILTEYDGSEYVRGSVRSIPTINMYHIIDAAGEAYELEHKGQLFQTEVDTQFGKRIINAFGGHAQACGFTLHHDNVPFFLEKVRAEMDKLPLEQFEYSYEILDTIQFHQINFEIVKKLDLLTPYGQAFDYPIFYLKGCSLSRGRAFGNKYQEARTPHVEFTVSEGLHRKNQGNVRRLDSVGFGLWEKYSQLVNTNPFGTFDIIFFIELVKKGRGRFAKDMLRLNVLDIRRSEDTRGIGSRKRKRRKKKKKLNAENGAQQPQGQQQQSGQQPAQHQPPQ